MTDVEINRLIDFIQQSIKDLKYEYAEPTDVFMNYYDFEALAKMKGLVKPGSIRELSDDRYRIFGLPINRWDGDTLVASAPKTKRYKNEASN